MLYLSKKDERLLVEYEQQQKQAELDRIYQENRRKRREREAERARQESERLREEVKTTTPQERVRRGLFKPNKASLCYRNPCICNGGCDRWESAASSPWRE